MLHALRWTTSDGDLRQEKGPQRGIDTPGEDGEMGEMREMVLVVLISLRWCVY